MPSQEKYENEDDSRPGDGFEDVLSLCIEAFTAGDMARVEEQCRAHPRLADRIRARMDDLRRLGLLGDDPALEAPRALGRYTIERRLGLGGMSVVYLAHDSRLDRRVALKTCPALAGEDDRVRARFEREIQAVAQLEHPGIVRIFDVGEAEGRPFFTMEYVEGATLAQVLEVLRLRGERVEDRTGESVRRLVEELVLSQGVETERAPVDHAWPRTWVETLCRWMLDVAGALAHAHAAGVVHRDVKPSNVIVGLDGRARLFDLGLAHLEGRPGLTRSGDFTGTPFYVSPEQLSGSGSRIDGRSDVFSLGVTLYELLTLQRPFDGRSTAHVFKQIVEREPVAPRRLDVSVPIDLQTICLTAMEKNPAARYQRMEDLAADLQRFLEFLPVRARPVGWARRTARFMGRNRALSAAAALLLFILVGLPIGLFLANRAVRRQRDLAERHAAEAERQAELSDHVTEFVVDLFQLTPDELARAESVTAQEILDRGASRIPSGFEGQPLVRASLMRANGRVYHNMGLDTDALPLLDRAFAIFQRELGEDHVETAGLLHDLARVHLSIGNKATSASLCRRSLAGFEAAGHVGGEEALHCLLTLARSVEEPAERVEVRDRIAAVLGEEREEARPALDLLADLVEQRGVLEAAVGDADAALSSLQESVDLRRASWVPDPLAIAAGLDRLAELHRTAGDAARAEELRAESRSLRRSVDTAPPASRPVPASFTSNDGPFVLRPPWQSEYEASFQLGVTALQSGRPAGAVAAFRRCLELAPGHTIAAYNLACSFALAGDLEQALHWVGQAIDFGFGYLVDGPTVLYKDPDLDSLRTDARWPALMGRMESRREAAARYAAEPAVRRPGGPDDGSGRPLLVVLHADGSTKDTVVSGPWGELAEELGLVLLAPSATIPTTETGARGMRWFRDVGDYFDRPWSYETPVIEAIRAFCQENRVDRREVYIAGEGMAALLAVDIALTAPGLFRGVLLVNGPLHPELASERSQQATRLGLFLELVLDEREPVAARPEEGSIRALAREVETTVAGWGLADRVGVQVAGGREDAAGVRRAGLAALKERLDERP